MASRSLGALLPRATRRVLTHFLMHPERRLHFRALRRQTGLGANSLQRELDRLEALGLLKRIEERGRLVYEPVLDHPTWDAFRTLFRQHADPAEVLSEALGDVPGIEAAWIFGSVARREARADSDVDLLVVGDDVSTVALGRALLEAQVLLDRPVDLKRFTWRKFRERLARGSGFLREAVEGPKAWVAGSPDALAAMGVR